MSEQLTPREANRLFHDRAMRRLGLSGHEFIRRWDADELDPDDAGVLEVAMLLPFGRAVEADGDH